MNRYLFIETRTKFYNNITPVGISWYLHRAKITCCITASQHQWRLDSIVRIWQASDLSVQWSSVQWSKTFLFWHWIKSTACFIVWQDHNLRVRSKSALSSNYHQRILHCCRKSVCSKSHQAHQVPGLFKDYNHKFKMLDCPLLLVCGSLHLQIWSKNSHTFKLHPHWKWCDDQTQQKVKDILRLQAIFGSHPLPVF